MNCGIFPTIEVRILGLGLAYLWLKPWPWLIGLGLGLDTSGFVNIPALITTNSPLMRVPGRGLTIHCWQ